MNARSAARVCPVQKRCQEDGASVKERAIIDAMAVRDVEKFDAAKRVEQDRAYADAMQKVSAQYPDDLDIVTLYADALFLLEPRRGTRDVKDPNVHRLHQVLEGILAKDVRHPGACHLYVHATESTVVPGRAEACAEFLGRSIPGASHINHMPSHTWNEVGRWGDSVRANLAAWHSDQKAAVGEGFAIYPEHNLHMLLYATSYDGQGAIAMRAGKDYARLTGESFYEVLTLIRFGRFDEVLAVTNRPKGDIQGGFGISRGVRAPQTGQCGLANLYWPGSRRRRDIDGAFRVHPAKDLLSIVAGILEGELQRTAGDVNAAITSFQRAASLQEGLSTTSPNRSRSQHSIGRRRPHESKTFEEAEKAYRAELKDHPHNGWSLLGRQQALKGRGVTSPEVDADLLASWSRADTWIRSSRF